MNTAAARRPQPRVRLQRAQRQVLLEVIVHGSRSRADIARRTGLSRTTLSRVTRELVLAGLLVEGSIQSREGRGRPSELLDLCADAAMFVGIKLTGDTVYAALVDLSGTVIAVRDRALEGTSVANVLASIRDVVNDIGAGVDLVGLGVCLAGDVREGARGQEIIDSAFLGWEGAVPLAALLEQEFGLPTAVANDVQALTAAHHWFGAGVGLRDFVVFGVGAGIGCGVVVNDLLAVGGRGHPGKVGHLAVTATGPVCDRGHVGCVSAYVTAKSIAANSGTPDFASALRAAESGDERAQTAFEDAARALGVAVATVVDIIDPERVVITGEGLPIIERARSAMDAEIVARIDPASEVPSVVGHPFSFADYAWAAGVSAIQAVLSAES